VNLLDLRNHAPAHAPSAWGLLLVVVNAICLGGSLVLVALGTVTGPLVLLTLGSGLSVLAAIAASRRQRTLDQQSHSLPRNP
jgi:hypothetical protein